MKFHGFDSWSLFEWRSCVSTVCGRTTQNIFLFAACKEKTRFIILRVNFNEVLVYYALSRSSLRVNMYMQQSLLLLNIHIAICCKMLFNYRPFHYFLMHVEHTQCIAVVSFAQKLKRSRSFTLFVLPGELATPISWSAFHSRESKELSGLAAKFSNSIFQITNLNLWLT